MNELTYSKTYLPDTIEDLTQFVLVGKAKLSAYMSRLQTVNKLSVAQEIRNQTLKETQELAEALIAAETRIGEILLTIPKSSGGDRRSDNFKSGNTDNFEKTKKEVTTEMGYSHNEVRDYQQMAKNPEVVRKVIDDALANGTVVSKTMVMKEIKALKEELRRAKEEKPEVRTVVKEVVPDDYREAKSKARAYDADTRKLNQKLTDAYNEQNKLRGRISELEKKTSGHELHARVVEGSLLFVTACGTFVRDYGGYIWITDHLNELSPNELKDYENAIRNMYAWSSKFLDALDIGKEKMLNG